MATLGGWQNFRLSGLNEAATGIESVYHISWAWPVTTLITFCCGYFLASGNYRKPI